MMARHIYIRSLPGERQHDMNDSCWCQPVVVECELDTVARHTGQPQWDVKRQLEAEIDLFPPTLVSHSDSAVLIDRLSQPMNTGFNEYAMSEWLR